MDMDEDFLDAVRRKREEIKRSQQFNDYKNRAHEHDSGISRWTEVKLRGALIFGMIWGYDFQTNEYIIIRNNANEFYRRKRDQILVLN